MGLRAVDPSDLVELLSQPDLTVAPGEDGLRRCVVRCRVPFSFQAAPPVRATRAPVEAQRAVDGSAPESLGSDGYEVIEGIASSTSVDYYGTRMTKPCLDDMARQFVEGIDYMPRHHSWTSQVEWDGVIGRTFEAEVRRAQVQAPKEGEAAQEQWTLLTRTRVLTRKPIVQELLACIDEGRAPGQSIGGWFREFSVTYDEQGDVVYPIDVLAVDLDHLAAVRSPANPDADAVWRVLTDKLAAAGRRSAPPPNSAPVLLHATPPETRSTESGNGATAPVPAPVVPQQRAMEIDMDPKQFEEMLARALAPLTERLATVEARTAAPAPVTPVPAPVARAAEPPAADLAAYWQARAVAAETQAAAIVAAAAGQPGQRATTQPTASAAQPAIPPLFRARNGSDLRELVPNSCREAGRVGAPEITGDIVLRMDGLKGLVQFTKASHEAPQLCDLVLSTPALFESGHTPRELRKRSSDDLRSLLADVIFAGMSDGLIRSKAAAASWNA